MIEWVVEKLISLIPAFENASNLRRELKDNALRSISHALNETCIYYSGLERGQGREMDIEAQLSRYWAAAAIPLRHIDVALAEACEYKSEYWLNPEKWSPEKIVELGIGLEKVRNQYRAIINLKSIIAG